MMTRGGIYLWIALNYPAKYACITKEVKTCKYRKII